MPVSTASAAPAAGRRASIGVVQWTGEILVTLGLVLLLYVAWQLWWTNIAADAAQNRAVQGMTEQYGGPTEPVSGDWDDQQPPVSEPVDEGQAIGIVYIPRFGTDYSRPVVEGTGAEVLDTLGLGHYSTSAMPGEVGNFSMAGHRQTNGKVLDRIDELGPADTIHVRTDQGYYTYVYRETLIVTPQDSSVIAPVPGEPDEQPTERLLTLTSCHPRFGDTERIIVHAEFDSWRPTWAGPPAQIASTVAADGKVD